MLQFMGSQRVGHDWVTELMIILSAVLGAAETTDINIPKNYVKLKLFYVILYWVEV